MTLVFRVLKSQSEISFAILSDFKSIRTFWTFIKPLSFLLVEHVLLNHLEIKRRCARILLGLSWWNTRERFCQIPRTSQPSDVTKRPGHFGLGMSSRCTSESLENQRKMCQNFPWSFLHRSEDFKHPFWSATKAKVSNEFSRGRSAVCYCLVCNHRGTDGAARNGSSPACPNRPFSALFCDFPELGFLVGKCLNLGENFRPNEDRSYLGRS